MSTFTMIVFIIIAPRPTYQALTIPGFTSLDNCQKAALALPEKVKNVASILNATCIEVN
jgi:hypothetical protein